MPRRARPPPHQDVLRRVPEAARRVVQRLGRRGHGCHPEMVKVDGHTAVRAASAEVQVQVGAQGE